MGYRGGTKRSYYCTKTPTTLTGTIEMIDSPYLKVKLDEASLNVKTQYYARNPHIPVGQKFGSYVSGEELSMKETGPGKYGVFILPNRVKK